MRTLKARAFGMFLFAIFASTLVARAALPPKIEAEDLASGKTVRAEIASAPRGTVVAFLSAKCPCSASHEITLETLRAKYEPLGFRFVGVHSNQDETRELAIAHFRGSSLKLPIVTDPGARLADAFGALKTPHVFVVSPRGELLFQGGVDDSHQSAEARRHFLADALDAIHAGRRPETPQARTLGCLISRK